MAADGEKTYVRVLVTPNIVFDVDSQNLTVIFTGQKYGRCLCCDWCRCETSEYFGKTNEYFGKTNEYFGGTNETSTILTISTFSIDGVEYSNQHIYLYRVGSSTYIDLDFSLVVQNDITKEKITSDIEKLKDTIWKYISKNNYQRGQYLGFDDTFSKCWDTFIYALKIVNFL